MDTIKVAAKSRTTAVAGAIAGVIRERGRAEVQAIGAGAVNQAVKAICIARTYLAQDGIDIVCIPEFTDVKINDQERTAIRFVIEKAMSVRLDLHVHTTASDGLWTPARVVQEALSRGLRYLAITDHETTQGVLEAAAHARGTPLEVIPGVEISVGGPEEEIDLLGYFIDPLHPELLRMLEAMQAERVERIRAMAERLARLGLPVPWERVLELARGDVLGRPHLARAMVEQGYVANEAEAFRRYLGRDRPAYVPRRPVDPQEVIARIRAAGGVAVLAHPGRSGLPRDLRGLWEAGLAGLEVYHPDHSEADTARLMEIARIYDLVPTGGSDFHGPTPDGRILLGAPPGPPHTVDRLRARRP